MIDTGCTWSKPIYIGAGDVLTDATAREILAHNDTYLKNCAAKKK